MILYLHEHEGRDPKTGKIHKGYAFDKEKGIRVNGEWLPTKVKQSIAFSAPDGCQIVEFFGFLKLKTPENAMWTPGLLFDALCEGGTPFTLCHEPRKR